MFRYCASKNRKRCCSDNSSANSALANDAPLSQKRMLSLYASRGAMRKELCVTQFRYFFSPKQGGLPPSQAASRYNCDSACNCSRYWSALSAK